MVLDIALAPPPDIGRRPVLVGTTVVAPALTQDGATWGGRLRCRTGPVR